MRKSLTPTDSLADPWRVLLLDALAVREVLTSEAEQRRLARTLDRLEDAANEAQRSIASYPAGAETEPFEHALDELAGD